MRIADMRKKLIYFKWLDVLYACREIWGYWAAKGEKSLNCS